MHIHHFIGMGDLNALRQVFNSVLFQHLQNLLPPADQRDLGAVGSGSVNGSQNRRFRCVVAAHSVENDLHMSHLFL